MERFFEQSGKKERLRAPGTNDHDHALGMGNPTFSPALTHETQLSPRPELVICEPYGNVPPLRPPGLWLFETRPYRSKAGACASSAEREQSYLPYPCVHYSEERASTTPTDARVSISRRTHTCIHTQGYRTGDAEAIRRTVKDHSSVFNGLDIAVSRLASKLPSGGDRNLLAMAAALSGGGGGGGGSAADVTVVSLDSVLRSGNMGVASTVPMHDLDEGDLC